MAQDSRFTLSDSLLEYKKNGSHLKVLGHEVMLGHDTLAIEVSYEGVAPITRYIDTASYLEIAEVRKDLTSGLPYKVVNEDFRRIDGVTTPFHKVAYKNGELVTDKRVTKITFLATLDDSLFEKPID